MPRNQKERQFVEFELDSAEFLALMAQPLKDAGLVSFDPTNIIVQEEITNQGSFYRVTVERNVDRPGVPA